ncbi:hypothetical protein OC834_007648, partial [Tilletia horrida]
MLVPHLGQGGGQQAVGHGRDDGHGDQPQSGSSGHGAAVVWTLEARQGEGGKGPSTAASMGVAAGAAIGMAVWPKSAVSATSMP